MDLTLIQYAKKIALYQGYPRLWNGLQPLNSYEFDRKMYLGLFAELGNEMEEFYDALANKTVWNVLYEVCDLYYYSVQIEYQMWEQHQAYIQIWSSILSTIEDNLPQFVSSTTIRTIAHKKFEYRQRGVEYKNEEYEISLMKKAVSPKN